MDQIESIEDLKETIDVVKQDRDVWMKESIKLELKLRMTRLVLTEALKELLDDAD